jgi:hypothetical protein
MAQASLDANKLTGFLGCGGEAGGSPTDKPAIDDPALIAQAVAQVSL